MDDTISLTSLNLDDYPRLTKERTRELLKRKDTDPEALKELVEGNLRLVIYVVKYQNRKGMDFMELVSEGTIALIHAIEKYNPDRDVELSTYAVPWIKQAVHRAAVNQGRLIRIPLEVSDKLDKLQVFIKNYTQEHGVEPSDKICAEKLGISVRKVKELKDLSNSILSLDMNVQTDEGDGKTLGEFISSDENADADTLPGSLSQMIDQEALLQAMEQLTDKEKYVIIRRFGLGDTDPWTLEKIADEIGITKEAVRQTEKRALRKLRAVMV